MNKFICTKCEKDFKSNYGLTRHLNIKTPCDQVKIKKEYICDRCLKQFSSNSRLIYHKNKKIPCIPVINTESNIIINNTNNTNNTTSNTNNTTNNTKNDITNYNTNNLIIFNSNSKPLDMTKINEILKNSDFKKIYADLLFLTSDNSNDSNDSIKTHILDIIDEINDLLKILYVDYNNKSGHIFSLDISNTSSVYVKKNINQIDELDDETLLYIIYETFKSIVFEYNDLVDKKLISYYKKFIKAYENGNFMNINYDSNIKQFIFEIRNKLADNLLELYGDLQNHNNNVKAYKNAKLKQSEFITYLKQKKEAYLSKIKHIGYSVNLNDLSSILNRLNSYKTIKIFDEIIISKDNYYILALIEYFVNLLYLQNKQSSIKLEKNTFYTYNVDVWIKEDQYEFIKNEIINYSNKLQKNNIAYDVNDNKYIEHYDEYDYEQFKYDIEDNYRGGLCLLHYTFQYIFKYKNFKEYKPLDKAIQEY